MESPTGTRLDILELLLRQELSSQSLAEKLGVSPAAVRQHLSTLDALGLVRRRKVVTRPNRPTYLYRVSAQGMRVFPKRYDLLLTRIIEVLAEQQGAAAAVALIEAAARKVAARAREHLGHPSAPDRWPRFLDWLESEFLWQAAVVEEASGARRLTIHQCPFQDLSKTEPDVCGVFFGTLIREAGTQMTVAHVEAASEPACCAFLAKPTR